MKLPIVSMLLLPLLLVLVHWFFTLYNCIFMIKI